uniref:Uncharacterized protein n=1 Tax=Anopheles coluzzii TaxID=1518534 RepID=A0A8W7P2A8_ANOCL
LAITRSFAFVGCEVSVHCRSRTEVLAGRNCTMYSSTVSDGNGALFHCSELTPRAPYRREFDEMEARIRKCERQRAELERQFEELMRERTECEKATVRAMKQRQRRQQEAERQRAERNESILRMLNKIDQQAASLAAKTDRLKMLKTQYEMYLMRTWSTSSGPALPAAYGMPMITAPPAMLTPLPQSPAKSSTKSEFVQYLSDLTHQQTANINPIPPPMALSNYLASQQKPYGMVSTYGTSLERPYSRAYTSSAPIENDCLMVNSGAGTSQSTTVGGIQAKKFAMSNEDFIRYIDSEVLKEPIPTVSIVAPSPVESDKVKQSGGAYLEDATMSEDEPVKEVANKLEEFSILVEPDIRKDVTEEHPKEDIKVVAEMIESAYINGAMGQPVEYQQDDGQQSAAYQYGNSQDPVAYQEGQYVEGETAGESQYQYQEGVDQTGNVYATQEQYQDPNQQYQYDQNAQYYSDQQAYDAQYYNQDPQQQEQQQQQQLQYYMDESNQQQMDQNQAEQLKPMDQFVSPEQNDQPYYPSDGQYEPNAKNAEPTQPNPPEGGDVTVPSSLEPPLANAQTVETSAVIDATLPKDKQEKKASDAIVQQATLEQKPSRKEGADPGSDAPTLSTVNDESDFDFSSQ